MRLALRTALLIIVSGLLAACTGQPTTIPTDEILADSFFFGCAYLDSNGNGEVDPDDQRLKGAFFEATMSEGFGFGASTSDNGCATIVVPGGLYEDSWPVTMHMDPLPETSYALISSADVVLEYPKSHADFLFADSQ